MALPMRHLFTMGIIFMMLSCGTKKQNTPASLGAGSPIKFEYAKGIQAIRFKSYTYLKIFTPNDSNNVFGEYILYKGEKPVLSIPIDGYIHIPVKHVAPLSTTHIGFISQLQKEQTVAGVTDPFRIFNPLIQQGLKAGTVKHLGESLSTDLERLIALSPDLVIESAFPNASKSKQTLADAGIPVIYTVDWMEDTPLGRAEWIRLFGLIYDTNETADSLFRNIADAYLTLKSGVSLPNYRPQVFAGNSFRGVWYLPGGNSYVSRLINDAGGTYMLESDTSTASLPVSFEVVFQKIANADIWINVEEERFSEMKARDERVGLFNPVKKDQVYNRNFHSNGKGANAYFESGICNPHHILSDLIAIFHPEVMPDHTWNYYKKVVND